VDFSFGNLYAQASSTAEGFQQFLEEWVCGVKDRTEYLQHYISRFGYSAFKALQAKFDYGYPVSYAY
jgi:glutaconate CoA-transferase subunit A